MLHQVKPVAGKSSVEEESVSAGEEKSAVASRMVASAANRFSKVFIHSAWLILMLTGVLKLMSAPQNLDYLAAPAPVFPELTWRQLLFITGVLELTCAIYVLRHLTKRASLFLILWLSSILLLFKISLFMISYTGPCNCMGFIGDWLGLSQAALDQIGWAILSFLIAGSTMSLLSVFRPARAGAILIIALSLGASELRAYDFKISGEQQAILMLGSKTALVQSVTFTVARISTNWSILNAYPESAAKQYIAAVGGRAYSIVLNSVDGSTSGGNFESPRELLDASPTFARVLFTAFLTTKDSPAPLTNSPVPFLFPRHPALYSYVWRVDWSERDPGLPERITFELNDELFRRIPRDAVYYYYPNRREAARLLKGFKNTQTGGAEYSTSDWKTFEDAFFPSITTLKSMQFEERTNHSYQSIHLVKVKSIERPDGYQLVPPLAPNSYVQHVLGKTNYLYQTTTGQWLSDAEAQRIGRARLIRPDTPLPSKNAPTVARFIIFLLLMTPIVFWFVNKKRRGTTPPT